VSCESGADYSRTARLQGCVRPRRARWTGVRSNIGLTAAQWL